MLYIYSLVVGLVNELIIASANNELNPHVSIHRDFSMEITDHRFSIEKTHRSKRLDLIHCFNESLLC